MPIELDTVKSILAAESGVDTLAAMIIGDSQTKRDILMVADHELIEALQKANIVTYTDIFRFAKADIKRSAIEQLMEDDLGIVKLTQLLTNIELKDIILSLADETLKDFLLRNHLLEPVDMILYANAATTLTIVNDLLSSNKGITALSQAMTGNAVKKKVVNAADMACLQNLLTTDLVSKQDVLRYADADSIQTFIRDGSISISDLSHENIRSLVGYERAYQYQRIKNWFETLEAMIPTQGQVPSLHNTLLSLLTEFDDIRSRELDLHQCFSRALKIHALSSPELVAVLKADFQLKFGEYVSVVQSIKLPGTSPILHEDVAASVDLQGVHELMPNDLDALDGLAPPRLTRS